MSDAVGLLEVARVAGAVDDLDPSVRDRLPHAVGDAARRVLAAMRNFVASATSAGAPPPAGPGGPGPA